MLDKYSSIDLLEEFSTVNIIKDENREIITELSKKARMFDGKLGTYKL